MANTFNVPIACSYIGSGGNMSCCYPNDQSNSICDNLFSPENEFLQNGCLTNNCSNNCTDLGTLYGSKLQTNLTGNGKLPIAQYLACVNLPSIASYANQGVLSESITKSIQPYMLQNTSDHILETITEAVTDCVSSTCRRSRHPSFCYLDYCSPVKLLRNKTLPDIEAINICLNKMCNHPIRSLPYADADVIGIGVFSSYIMQCIFIIILWLGFLGFAIYQYKRGEPERPSEPGRHYKSWISLLLEFHKAQCFFSATLMIASLNYGIYNVDMLVTFLLIPLATNSVLPVVFAYLLLLYYRKSSAGVTILTISVYILSTLVYWTLYRHLIPLSGEIADVEVYEQFMFKLSALPACGGHSGLSICPSNEFNKQFPNVDSARHRIRVLTPLIWTYSTFIFVALLGYRLYQRLSKRSPDTDSSVWHMAFWFSTVVFLAGTGMQLNVLSIDLELQMIDPQDWKFGQIIAVTVWIPPLLEYIYEQISDEIKLDSDGEKKHGAGYEAVEHGQDLPEEA